MKPVIHKQMIDNKRNGDSTWNLCEPEKVFTGVGYHYSYPNFAEWSKQGAYRWKTVTCPKCIQLRIELK